MQNENHLTPADRELEQALGAIAPSPVRIDRDRLMFEAGRRSSRQALRRWQAVAAVLAVGVGASLLTRPQVKEVDKPIYVEVPRQPDQVAPVPTPVEQRAEGVAGSTALALSEDSYLAVQHRVLSQGLDALPKNASPNASSPLRGMDLLRTIRDLNGDLDRFDRPGSLPQGGQS